MASTVTQILAKFKRRYPDCSDARAQELFAEAHRLILSRIQIRNTTVDVSLTAGTREYTISPDIFKIHSAYYQADSTGPQYQLTERSTDELDVMRPSWRVGNWQGQPYEYYVSSLVSGDSAGPGIGFVPVPVTTTATGYPKVVLYVTQWADLSGSETVPTQLLNDNVYVYQMYALWCADATSEANMQMLPFWEEQAERQMQLNHEHVMGLQSQGTTGYFPTAAYMPTRVV